MGPAWVEPALSKDKCVLFDDTTSRMKHSTAEPQKCFEDWSQSLKSYIMLKHDKFV